MRHFLIKAYVGAEKDPFRMREGKSNIVFFAKGLSDLEKSCKALLPLGYRVQSGRTLSKRLKGRQILEAKSLFDKTMLEIKEIPAAPEKFKQIDHANKSRRTIYRLKLVKTTLWDHPPAPT